MHAHALARTAVRVSTFGLVPFVLAPIGLVLLYRKHNKVRVWLRRFQSGPLAEATDLAGSPRDVAGLVALIAGVTGFVFLPHGELTELLGPIGKVRDPVAALQVIVSTATVVVVFVVSIRRSPAAYASVLTQLFQLNLALFLVGWAYSLYGGILAMSERYVILQAIVVVAALLWDLLSVSSSTAVRVSRRSRRATSPPRAALEQAGGKGITARRFQRITSGCSRQAGCERKQAWERGKALDTGGAVPYSASLPSGTIIPRGHYACWVGGLCMTRRLYLYTLFAALMLLGLTLIVCWMPVHAQTAPPAGEPQQTSFAYAAPAFIKELDTKYAFPPPTPPWPPRLGGTLHMATPVLRAFDPTVTFSAELTLVYDTLLEWEGTWYFPEIQTTPMLRKNLVESWEMIDPSTWDFRLRQGVKFHNRPPVNGRELTAEDVKYSYELLKSKPGFSNRGVLVKTVEVRDPYTARFHLESPDPNFPLVITNGFSPVIVPREAVEAEGGLGKNPIGTGAFMLKEFVPGEGILLVKNPHYHMRDKDGRPLPYLDAMRLMFTRDSATELALFRTKHIDIMRGPPTLDMLFELLKTVPDTQVYRIPSFGWGAYELFLRLDKAPYNDVRVRRAISMAINRDVVAEVINRGDAALYGPFPWALAGYRQRTEYSYENLGPYYQYNPQKAKELLAEAGYPNGFAMTIEWGEQQGYVVSDFVTVAARFLQDIGIQVKLKQVEFSTWWAMRMGAQPYNEVLGVLSPPGSGPAFLDWGYLPYHSKAPATINVPRITDPKLDALLDEWRVAPLPQQPALQQHIWDYLREQVYRISTIVPPHYRTTQSYAHAGGNPYCWFPGFCSYEGKTAWMTDKAPGRKFDKFAQ